MLAGTLELNDACQMTTELAANPGATTVAAGPTVTAAAGRLLGEIEQGSGRAFGPMARRLAIALHPNLAAQGLREPLRWAHPLLIGCVGDGAAIGERHDHRMISRSFVADTVAPHWCDMASGWCEEQPEERPGGCDLLRATLIPTRHTTPHQ